MNTVQATNNPINPTQNIGEHMKDLAFYTIVPLAGLSIPLLIFTPIIMSVFGLK